MVAAGSCGRAGLGMDERREKPEGEQGLGMLLWQWSGWVLPSPSGDALAPRWVLGTCCWAEGSRSSRFIPAGQHRVMGRDC